MDDSLKSRKQLEAEQVLVEILKYIVDLVAARDPYAPGVPAFRPEDLVEKVERYTYLVIEAAAEKGRGQIRT